MSNHKYDHFCVYIGRRVGDKGEVYQVFLRDGKKSNEMGFKRISGVSIGNTYRCGLDSMPRRPEWVHDRQRIDDPEWEAQDELAKAHLDKRRAKAKANALAGPQVKAALQALEPLVKGMTYWDMDAIVRSLCNRIIQKRGKV